MLQNNENIYHHLIRIDNQVSTRLHETGFWSAFMPVGYPSSVAPEYFEFQCWDTTQAMCSYLRGILATQAILQGVGVGNREATALAATLQWILRDGVSMLGRS